jgi:NADPH-dependent 2,4-dienoyl-CoA reductase/sulfur reductase-like enzyme
MRHPRKWRQIDAVSSLLVSSRAVVVGASLAGLRAAEALRREGHDGPLTIVGGEAHLPYDRPPLSKQVLTRKTEPDGTALHMDASIEADWLLGVDATGLDIDRRRVLIDDRDDLPFDKLVIATGAHPRMLPGAPPGNGVHYLRTLEDSVALRDELAGASHATVIGAGFIGLEVASSAHELGLSVTVLEALPVPLERAIGADMGAALAEWHRRRGIDIRLRTGVETIEGSGRVEGVRLDDGTVVATDLVIVGIGVQPTTAWLSGSGVDIGDGVVCDSKLRVSVGGKTRPDIVAAGDVARWFHVGSGAMVRVEHWTNATEQGEAAGTALARPDEAGDYAPTPYFWSDQHGVKLQFVGEARPGDDVSLVEGSIDDDRFLVAYGREGRLVAALGMRRPARIMALQRMIGEGAEFPLGEANA